MLIVMVPKIAACGVICVGYVGVRVLQHRRKVSGKVTTPCGQKGNAVGYVDHLVGGWRQCNDSKVPGQWPRNPDESNIIGIVVHVEIWMDVGLEAGLGLTTRVMGHCIESQVERLTADRTTGGCEDPHLTDQGTAANG